MPQDSTRSDRATIAAGVLAMVMFSGNFAVARHGLEAGLAVADLVLLRYLVSGPLFLALLWRIGLGGLSLGRCAALTLLAGAPYFLLVVAAMHFAPATHAAILNPGATMLGAVLLGWLLAGDRPEIGVRVGVPVLAAGLALIGGAGLLEGGGLVWVGDLLLVCAGFGWALYGVLIRRWSVPGLRAACVIGAFSLPWVPAHLALLGTGGIRADPGEAAIQALYQGLIGGGIAVILYSRAVALLGPARGAMLPPLVPALGVFWAWLLLGEAVTTLQVAGMALVVAGMFCGALWRGRPAAQRTKPLSAARDIGT